MKIGRFRSEDSSVFWAVVNEHEATVRQLNGRFESWAPELALADEPPSELLGEQHDLSSLTVLAPVADDARVFALGINYANHAAALVSDESPAFMKPLSALVDPGNVCRFPPHHEQLDYEIELVAIVAMPLDAAPQPTAALLGYTIGDDGSVRDVGRPLGGIDLYSAKAQDGSSPVGPWVATLRETGGLEQPDLEMCTYVNGDLRQKDSTKDMIFPVEWILQYINERNILRPGDLIFTGTVAGTAADASHPWLQAGDQLRMSIERIGELTFSIGPKPSPSLSAVERRAQQ